MALSWPLSLAEFFSTLPIKHVSMRLGRADVTSETGGGELITHKMGSRLWQGEIQLGADYHFVWAALEARLSLLEEPGASLLVTDTRLPGPMADPGGVILGASNVTIHALVAGNRELRLTGLPAGYVISQGDLIGFEYGSNPNRHALHRVVTGGAAGGGGTTPALEVTPFIRAGAVTGTPVTLISPVCKARIIAADYGASRALVSPGGTIQWKQTLR